MGGYDPQGREIVLRWRAFCAMLTSRFGVLRKEKCTGDPARRLGNDLAFAQLAEANIETLRQSQGEKDGLHLPALRAHHRHGLGRIRRKLRRSSITANFLRGIWTSCPIEPAPSEKIVFHDPCYLGRYRNVYDEPREVVAQVRRR